MYQSRKASIFTLPLEICQMIYEYFFPDTSNSLLSLGPWSYTRSEQAKEREPLLASHPQIRQELQEWTKARFKSFRKITFTLHTRFRYLHVTREELKDFVNNYESDTIKHVGIHVPYYDTEETLEQQRVSPYVLHREPEKLTSPEVREEQLRSPRKHMASIVRALKKVCKHIDLLTIRYDPGWFCMADTNFGRIWRSDLLAWSPDYARGDDEAPRSVVEYILAPLLDLKRPCKCVVLDDLVLRCSIGALMSGREDVRAFYDGLQIHLWSVKRKHSVRLKVRKALAEAT